MTVVLVSASLVLAGCQQGAEPAASVPVATPTVVTGTGSGTVSTGTATAAGTSTASVDPGVLTVVPKAARAHTNAGAQAFAEFYLSQLNKAWSRPDPEAIRPYATSACKTCAAFVETAKSLSDDKQRYGGPAVTVQSSAWYPESTPTLAVVYVISIQEATPVVDASGQVVERGKRENAVSAFDISWRADGWMVDEIQLVKSK